MTRHPSASTEIDAPLEVVWSVMTDTDRYQENPFVVRVDCEQPTQVGTPIRLLVESAGGKQGRVTGADHRAAAPVRRRRPHPPGDQGRVEDGFRRHAAALKQRAEELSRGRASG